MHMHIYYDIWNIHTAQTSKFPRIFNLFIEASPKYALCCGHHKPGLLSFLLASNLVTYTLFMLAVNLQFKIHTSC